jgi:hypothetical protein
MKSETQPRMTSIVHKFKVHKFKVHKFKVHKFTVMREHVESFYFSLSFRFRIISFIKGFELRPNSLQIGRDVVPASGDDKALIARNRL